MNLEKFAFPRLRLIAVCCLLSACAGQMAHREGVSLLAQGKDEEALQKLDRAVQEAPDNAQFRLRYLQAREGLINKLISQAQQAQQKQQESEAETSYRRVLALDAKHIQANEGLAQIEQRKKHKAMMIEAKKLIDANNLEAAKGRLLAVLQEDSLNADARALYHDLEERIGQASAVMPILTQNIKRPVSIEVRDTNLKQVIEILARHSGVNFIFDKDVPANLMITTWLRQVTVEDALDVILSTHNLQKRVLNENTLLIFPNTQAKQNEHQELVVKGLYLANADAKSVLAMLKGVLKIKNAHIDEKLNLIVIRDTPDAIRLAERMLAMMDIGEPEVMMEVEVLEVKRSRLSALGIQIPNQLTLSPLPSTGTTVTLADLRSLNSGTIGATLSNAGVNAKLETGNTNLLANPRIRARSKEKAIIKIGDRVPVTTTTASATGFVAENIQYVDVGLKLEVEPTVYLDNEIAIKLNLEVSSVVKEIKSATGNTAYQIGGRNASTVIRLKDGETQILGGLISDEERKTGNRIPGLGDLPVVGRLFGTQTDDDQKTELVLSITPRLIRGVTPPKHVPTEFWSGTEADMRVRSVVSMGNRAANLRMSPSLSAPTPTTSGATLTSQVSAPVATAAPPAAQPLPEAAKAEGKLELGIEGANQAKVGQVVELLVNANITGKLISAPIQFKFDPNVFAVEKVSAGELSGQGAEFTHKILGTAGVLLVSQTRKPNAPYAGAGNMVRIQLKALKAAERSVVTLLPATPLALDNKPLPQTAPVAVGISVAP